MTNGDQGLLLVLLLLVMVTGRMMMMMMMVVRRWWRRRRRRRRSCVNGYGEKGGPAERTGFRVYVDVDDRRGDKRVTVRTTLFTRATVTVCIYIDGGALGRETKCLLFRERYCGARDRRGRIIE